MGKLAGIIAAVICVIAITIVMTRVLPTTEEGSDGETRELVVAANAELHQAQTAIIACMADAESSTVTVTGAWSGGQEVYATSANATIYYANAYVYGPFRAAYTVLTDGSITSGDAMITGGWGSSIVWDTTYYNWKNA